MTLDPLAGHVVVLAGTEAAVGLELMSRGVLLAVVSEERSVLDELEQAAATQPTAVLLSYRADPCDRAVWERIAAHIEQRVGPVDAVLCVERAAEVVEGVFAEDMRRRGHGAVVPLSPAEDPVEALRRLLRRTP